MSFVWSGGQCWGIYSDEGDWACGGVKAESQEALGAAAAWLDHSQLAVPPCKSNSVLSGLVRALLLLEEGVVPLLRGTSLQVASWIVAMFIFSLLSSSLMAAVCLESLVSCKLAERPVIIVRTFQHPSFETGFF